MEPKLCDNGKVKNSCDLSFHGACYEHHWGEAKQYKKCICRHCASVVMQWSATVRSVAPAQTCTCKLNFYCVVCHHVVWALDE